MEEQLSTENWKIFPSGFEVRKDDGEAEYIEDVETPEEGRRSSSADGSEQQRTHVHIHGDEAPTQTLHPIASKKWYRDANLYRLVLMLCMLLAFMCAEFAVGFITNSLALVSDAYHMASDSISIVVAIVALQLAKRNRATKRFSYGLAPAETIGGLINGVFLLSVCFFIVLEAIQRFIDVPEVTNPLLVAYVGAGGLVMNLIGLLLFMGHGGHGHSHGGGGHGHSHGHGKKKKDKKKSKKKDDMEVNVNTEEDETQEEPDDEEDAGTKDGEKKKKKKKKKAPNHNLHAVFLHVLGDALGSLAAITSGLCIEFIPWGGRYYIDPALSCMIAAIITYSAVPLVWRCCVVLMQSVPAGVDIERLTKDLEEVPMVVKVHDLHVWSLGNRQIATAHILCPYETEFMKVANQIKKTFHDHDIHFVTLQPEFLPATDIHTIIERSECVNECDEGKAQQRKRKGRPERSGTQTSDEEQGPAK